MEEPSGVERLHHAAKSPMEVLINLRYGVCYDFILLLVLQIQCIIVICTLVFPNQHHLRIFLVHVICSLLAVAVLCCLLKSHEGLDVLQNERGRVWLWVLKT